MTAIPEKTLSDLEWPTLLDHLASRCQTERGAERARALRPLERVEDVVNRQALVRQVRELCILDIRVSLSGVEPLEDLLERVSRQGVLTGEELLKVVSTLEACSRLRRVGREHASQAPDLAVLLESLRAMPDVREAIAECFDEHGALVDHASAELQALRQRTRGLRHEATTCLKGLLANPVMERVLQDDYYTDHDDRYVLPIKAEFRHEVTGIVSGSSASGATVFIEPEVIVGLNNRLKLSALELEREERRILNDLSLLVREERLAIGSNLDRLALVDLVVASARLAEDTDCGPLRLSDSGRLHLRGLRHPLMVLAGTAVVENDAELFPGAALIVTGPNTGGKTVFIKTIGLCALMVRSGLVPTCSGETTAPLYESVLTDMGDDQSIATSLSTFSAHMTNIGCLLERAGPGSLVLLDEVAVGTDPIQGAALARAIVEAFADREAQILVTTHYAELKELPARDARFTNASFGFDLEQIRPTYRMVRGAPGSSSALSVARRLGLPAELLERAAGLLDPAAVKLDHLLESLGHERLQVNEERERLADERAQQRQVSQTLDARLREVDQERRRLREKSYDEAVTALRGARDDLERVRRQLRRAKSADQVQRLSRQVDRNSASIAEQAPTPEGPPSRPVTAADLASGVSLWAGSLGREVSVVSWSGSGSVQVQAGALKARIPLEELRLLTARPSDDGKRTKKGASKAKANSWGSRGSPEPPTPDVVGRMDVDVADDVHVREPQTTCDLRGLRVDEAEDAIARFLDRVVMDGVRSVLIIHGHGTGALRRQVREQLRRVPEVRRTRPGGPRDGGDGVTVAYFE